MPERPRVFVSNDTGHDFTKAREFGDLTIIASGKVNLFNVTTLFIEACDALADSDHTDWIIPVGLPLMSALVCSAFAYKHNRLNLLLWRARERDYVPRIISFGSLLEHSMPGQGELKELIDAAFANGYDHAIEEMGNE